MRLDPRRLFRPRHLLLVVGIGLILDAIVRAPGRMWSWTRPDVPFSQYDFARYVGFALVGMWVYLWKIDKDIE